MDIVMDGSRFHVSDESGAHPSDILGDVRAPRGLGRTPGSLEEIMDINSDWRRGPVAEHPTELYGDLASTEGWVRDRRLKEWSVPARELAPVAEQMLAFDESSAGLDASGETECLGRRCTEYSGVIKSEGVEVVRRVSGPFLMYSSVRDLENANYFFTREIVALEEGGATDADLKRPD
jgi:hypothetical protein